MLPRLAFAPVVILCFLALGYLACRHGGGHARYPTAPTNPAMSLFNSHMKPDMVLAGFPERDEIEALYDNRSAPIHILLYRLDI